MFLIVLGCRFDSISGCVVSPSLSGPRKCNTTTIQLQYKNFSCIAVVLHLCRPLAVLHCGSTITLAVWIDFDIAVTDAWSCYSVILGTIVLQCLIWIYRLLIQ